MANRKRVLAVLLQLLGAVLLCVVLFLQGVRWYFHIPESAYILRSELGTWDEIRANTERPAVFDNAALSNMSGVNPPDKIPKIIHQTWKTDIIPDRWVPVRNECAAMHPDYEYMLWTDESSRKLIETDYPWFLPVFDSYPYNIQRADVIRYFVLHKYGGVYMDLDIGCVRPMDPLLRFDVILPRTIPVGVSNDLMLASKAHPFLVLMIDNLKYFNHAFITPYATVMFSTGPMFVSALYHKFSLQHVAQPSTPDAIDAGFNGVRILPKALYGKNVDASEAPDSFYRHYYGSSWHAGDAGILIFLRKYGYLMVAIVLLALLMTQIRRMRRVFVSLFLHVSRLEHPGANFPGGAGNDAHKLPRDSVESQYEQFDSENVPLVPMQGEAGANVGIPPRTSLDSSEHGRRISAEQSLGTFANSAIYERRNSLPAYYIDTPNARTLDVQAEEGVRSNPSSVSTVTLENGSRMQRRFSKMRRVVFRNIAAPFTSLVPSALRVTRRPNTTVPNENSDADDTIDDRLSIVSIVSRNTDTLSDPGDDAQYEWNSIC
ncbi:hypothetical protein MCUN1_003151 [Malassezia cuniculi]|uniref:Mannosyl phosphorylinositol ceramide synthase SUR1 n=1 Tax=Malassezia cuniculi TaxID=948313 RepID=A0AAF0ESL4_9BASI|nr:hypothetical protein MCUN1_003151 [Malassezia cuniculi]